MQTKNSRQQLIRLLVLALALALIMVACTSEEPTPTPVPTEAPVVEPTTAQAEVTEPADTAEVSQPTSSWSEVADARWVLVGYGDALNPTVVEEGLVITALFSSSDATVSGSGGCNNYFGGYTADDNGSLTIDGPIGSTMMACESGMETEAAYLAALQTVSAWTLTAEGRLALTYSSGQSFEEQLVFAPGETPLAGTTWRLVSFGDPDNLTPLVAGTSITALFTPDSDTSGTISGNATCNNYTTGYTLEGSNISFGPIAGTMMLCPVGAEQEVAFLAALGSAQSFQIAGPNLQIAYDGGVLNFTSQNLPLENVLWQAVMVGDQPVPEGVVITALFTPGEVPNTGTVGGSTSCNSYSTGFETSSDDAADPPMNGLAIASPMAMTQALCPDEALNQLEQSYLAALATASSYEVFGNQLVVTTDSGDIQFAADRQPLLGTLWSLVSLGDLDNPQAPVEGSSFTAQFSRLPILPTGTVVGGTGCNQYNATFTANLAEIKVNLPATTRQECGDAQLEAEQQFFLGLNAATTYRILGNNLQIMYGEGETMQVLNFVATQPPPVVGEALDLTPLQGTFWYLSAIGDSTTRPGTEITAQFDINDDGTTGAISGSGGCNGYNAAIGENFAVGPIASTARACDQPVMDQESTYFTWLQTAYAFNRAGDQLLLSTASGILTFNSRPVLDQAHLLVNRTWYLLSYEALNAVPGSNPTAFFAADGSSVNGTTGCNNYTGTYQAQQGNLLTISGLASSLAACPSEDLTRQEQTFTVLMQSAVRYSVNDSQLQIVTADGGTMNFTLYAPAQPAGPTAVINGPDQADVGQLLVYDAFGSTAGDAPITHYEWDMGDGGFATGPQISYSYQTAGTYIIELTVTDRAGQQNSVTLTVVARPVVDVTPPGAAIEGPVMAFVGDQVTFSAANSTQGTGAISSFQWQSGDGNNSDQIPDNSFTTIYTRPGIYYPVVTVTDANGLSDSASMQIVINARLEGTNWSLSSAIPGTAVTLQFSNGSVSGFSGCNSYNATYSSTLMAGNSNNISIGPIISGGQLCTEEIMNQEQAFLAALQTATSYTITANTLTITTAEGTLTFFAVEITPFAAQ
ncbi:MAG: META domain-containing protein [Pseudomonadales bacterium]|nr:META domain-containing protein [Anaerolineales bacterium]MCB8918239.1 META domain-containing protein [Ardenticatenaceae bacterium]MCP5190732.1 META domain-containing protein [Pseudomonadales bacterium]